MNPHLGYVVEIDCKLEIDKLPERGNQKPRGKAEFTNMMVGGMVDMWPGRWKYDRTVLSRYDMPEGKYWGWWNNPAAADISDDNKELMKVRPGGSVAFLSEAGYSPALSRTGDYTFSLATCNVWQDQHNHVAFPAGPDADGMYRLNPKFRLCYLPPELTAYVGAHTKINDFGGQKELLLPFGVLEGFEEQPKPLTTSLRGAYGTRFNDSQGITDEVAYSGRKSLVIEASPTDKAGKGYDGFLFTPQFNSDLNTRYSVEARVRVDDPNTEAWIQGDL